MDKDGFTTYILRCRDGTLYTGYARDACKRLAAHNAGSGAKYTRSRLPVTLAHTEHYATKSEAMSREAYIKQMTHEEKELLISSNAGTNVKAPCE